MAAPAVPMRRLIEKLAHSDDVEMLEIVMPAGFATEEVAAVDEHASPGGG